MCTRVKATNKTQINYSGFDISDKLERRVSIGFPLMVDGVNLGTIIFEGDQARTFE